MSRVVAGIYKDKERVTKAVEGLLAASVPVDEISVILGDESGAESRFFRASDYSGVGRGATVGGLIGAGLGALGVSVVATGIALSRNTSLAAAGPILILLMGGSSLTGAAIGAPLGMGRWGGLSDVAVDDLQRGAAVVAVHSDDLAGAAREIFVRTGADALTETWTAGSTELSAASKPVMRMSVR